jgi:O-antigen/teichoic acid export membrane protein
MFNLFKRNNDSFVRSVVTLASGTAIMQILNFATVPLLANFYSPSDYGIAASFLGVATIVSVIASMRYELAIVLPSRDIDAVSLVYLSIFLTLLITMLSSAIIFFIRLNSGFFYIFSQAPALIILIPASILFIALFNIFNYWHIRNKQFSNIARARVAQAIVTLGFQLILAFSGKAKVESLIMGYVLGQAIGFNVLFFPFIKSQTREAINIEHIINNAKVYKNFPLFSSWANYINALALQTPVLLLPLFYSAELTGLFSMAQRVVQAPFALITSSLAQVYYQKATEIYHTKGHLHQFTCKFLAQNALIGIMPIILISIFAEDIFRVFFGEQWLGAVQYAHIIVFLSYANFIGASISLLLSLFGLQKFESKFNIILLLFNFASIFIGYQFFNSAYVSIVLLSISGAFLYLYLTIYLMKITRSLS